MSLVGLGFVILYLGCTMIIESSRGVNCITSLNKKHTTKEALTEIAEIITDSLISWESDIQNFNLAKRRVPRSTKQTQNFHVEPTTSMEYLSVDCGVICWLEYNYCSSTTESSKTQNILTCKNETEYLLHNKECIQVLVPIKCVIHILQGLLHVIISEVNIVNSNTNKGTDGVIVDYLSVDFSLAIRQCLFALTRPQTLYLTIKIPILQIRYGEFTHISTWLKRLSLYMGQSNSVDRSFLTLLSLDSFTAEGCNSSGVSFENELQPLTCGVVLLFSCPQIVQLSLIADKSTMEKYCGKSIQNPIQIRKQRGTMSEPKSAHTFGSPVYEHAKSVQYSQCSCADVWKIIEQLLKQSSGNINGCVGKELNNISLYISIMINVILSIVILIMLLIIILPPLCVRKRSRVALNTNLCSKRCRHLK